MSNPIETVAPAIRPVVLPFPLVGTQTSPGFDEKAAEAEDVPTPVYDAIVAEADELEEMSKYKSTFNYEAYRNLEMRFAGKEVRGGIICKTDLKLANFHPSCSKCHYTLELDTYGRGCAHECAYCYAKDELSLHGYWNNPMPFPIDVNAIRRIFFTVFETSRKSKWRSILERRVPIRIGSMSDSFMWSDLKHRVTLEVLNILNFYKYPYLIFTRSDLVAHDLYLKTLDPTLCSVQFSICGGNEAITKKFEPGAPSVARRIKALVKLSESGVRTAVRINPLFPTYPDGYFSDYESVLQRFGSKGAIPKFEFFDIENADEFIGALAGAGVKTLLTGFVRLKSSSLNLIAKNTGFDLRGFFKPEVMYTGLRGNREKKYSDAEIAYYYRELWRKTKAAGLNFSTCYIGNGAKDYYQYQSIWDNKRDCCDVVGNVPAFKSSAQQIEWKVRAKFCGKKGMAEESEAQEKILDKEFRMAGQQQQAPLVNPESRNN